MDNPLYQTAFTVEEVNHLVAEGVPFRDAYKQVGAAVMEGKFQFNGKLHPTHEGSLGKLCNAEIAAKCQKTLQTFGFEQVEKAINALLDSAEQH